MMKKWTRTCFLGGLFFFCASLLLALPGTAVAQPQCKGKYKNDPGCDGGPGGGGGGGQDTSGPYYEVALIDDAGLVCDTPLFDPGDQDPPILATTHDLTGYSARYPRHLSDGGPTLTMDSGAQLADDVRIVVGTNDSGQIVSVQITGQPEIGKEALAHESEVVQLAQSVEPLVDQPFYVHVDTDYIPVWQLTRHLGGKRVEIVGYFCLGDMLYTPQP